MEKNLHFVNREAKTKVVAFKGCLRIEHYTLFTKAIKSVVSRLIEEENAETFLFANNSSFDRCCLDAVTELKRHYPLIRRVCILPPQQMPQYDLNCYRLHDYDEIYNPYTEGKYGYGKSVNRSQIMIDKSDILVTYYADDYRLFKGARLGAKMAINYALKKNKKVVNIYCEEFDILSPN